MKRRRYDWIDFKEDWDNFWSLVLCAVFGHAKPQHKMHADICSRCYVVLRYT